MTCGVSKNEEVDVFSPGSERHGEGSLLITLLRIVKVLIDYNHLSTLKMFRYLYFTRNSTSRQWGE